MINLRTRTEYSFRYAYGHLDRVLAATGDGPLAICDRGGTNGHTQFEKAMKKAGRKPIFGVELAVVEDVDAKDRKARVSHLGFLAKNLAGLEELYALTSRACDHFYYQPRIGWDDVVDLSDNIFILSGSSPDWAKLSIGYAGALLIELSPTTTLQAIEFADKHGCPLIATSDNLYPLPGDRAAYQIIAGRNVDNRTSKSHLLTNDWEWMNEFKQGAWRGVLSEAELMAALSMTMEVANDCNVELPNATMVPYPHEKSLRLLCVEAAEGRGIDLDDPVYAARLERELTLIAEKKYEDYFYVVWDMLQYAHRHMLVGPARGSSAGSLVCYLLSITQIDPIPHDLLFERFIDINREDLPDIDIDFPDDRRDMVFDYVERKYGTDCVARLGTVSRYKAKSTISEVAKALDIPPWEVSDLKDAIVERSGGDARASFCILDTFTDLEAGRQALAKHPELRIAADLEAHARHSGQHAAGIIILADPVSRYAGVDRVGAVMADKKDAEDRNMLKIDALGLRTLSVIQDCLDQIDWGREKLLGWPLDDAAAFKVINDHRFAGIFQFEGYALQSLSVLMNVAEFNDMAALTALARPGPLHSGGANEFIKRKTGEDAVRYFHPLLEEITEPTLGIVIYQEQVMQIARTMGKLSWEDVSQLRKALSKSLGVEFFDRYWEKFKVGAASQGIGEEVAREVWEQINTMGSWAFNRSHAVAYGLVSYWCCILKAHHPLEYAAACLRHAKDDEQVVKLLRELVNEGYEYVAFDRERIQLTWFVDGGKIYGGLRGIKGIGPKLASDIMQRITDGDDLTPRQEKLLTEPQTPYDVIYPAERYWGDLKRDPEAYGILTPITDIGTIKEHDTGTFLIVGRMMRRNLRDLNETMFLSERNGERVEENSRWLNLAMEDDTGSIMATVSRADYAIHGDLMIEDAKVGDWFMLKGRAARRQRRIYVQRVRKLVREESGEISLVRALDGRYTEKTVKGSSASPTTNKEGALEAPVETDMSMLAPIEETETFLKNVANGKALLAAYNVLADEPTKRFSSRASARARLAKLAVEVKVSREGLATLLVQNDGEKGLAFSLLETDYVTQLSVGEASETPEGSSETPEGASETPEGASETPEDAPSAAPDGTKTSRKASKKRTPKQGAKRGRSSSFAGKTIVKKAEENPRRAGTHGHRSWELLTQGMTYEAYIEAGGRPNDLKWDVEHGWAEVK